jgi:hypothetical protein
MKIIVPASVTSLLSKADVAGGASQELISFVEQQYGLKFPDQYRAFLGEYGAALLPGFEIYGLVDMGTNDGPPVWSDIRLLLERAAFRKMPASLVPISDDGGDYKFYVQCGNPEVGSILVYGPGRDGVIVSDSFFDFIQRALTQGLESML